VSDITEARLQAGEAYVICNECGARLWSTDADPANPQDIYRACPYKHDAVLAEDMGCPNKGYY